MPVAETQRCCGQMILGLEDHYKIFTRVRQRLEGFEQLMTCSNLDLLESLDCYVESRLQLGSGIGSGKGKPGRTVKKTAALPVRDDDGLD